MPSPCIGCDFEHKDKNTDRCANCEKRIRYAEDQLMIPNEALEADRAAREETKKITELRTGRPAKKRGPKPKPPKTPNEAVSIDEVEDEHRVKLEEINETQMAIDAADLKAGESSEKKRGRPAKPGVNEAKKAKDEMLRKGIYIRPTEFCPGIQIQEILEGVKEIANTELRSLPQQVLWILKQRVEDWKKEHDS